MSMQWHLDNLEETYSEHSKKQIKELKLTMNTNHAKQSFDIFL